ncbi:MAG: hypothetical protein VYA55_05050 [Pseudomonadota bacterium]|nr:hypothetical protein [Pseudomonadota bacterium]
MNRHLNSRITLPVLSLYWALPTTVYADNMGGWGNPIFLVFLAIGVGIFYLIPLIGWLISINILKSKFLNKYDYGTVKSISFWALFSSGTVGFFILALLGSERLYEVLGFSLPSLSAILVIAYAVIKKKESSSK